jgi:coproporphyrinogen III oxidase-like Fe-S oxidoreductase
MLDYLTLGLRLREGVSLAGFSARFGVDLPSTLGETGAWLISAGFLECNTHRLRVADEHQLITNEILVRLRDETDLQARRDTSASQIALR